MATTYFTGNKQNVTGQSIASVGKIKTGRIDKTSGVPLKTEIMGVNVKQGKTDGRPQRGAVSDRAPNVPSGFAANRSPTYGQGKQNINTVLAADQSGAHPNSSFTYFSPLKPSKKKFSALI